MYYILLVQTFGHDFLSGVLDITSSVKTITEGNDMRRMYQSKMYQVNGTSALASYKPAFKVIEGGAKKGSVAPQLEEVSYVKALTNKEAFIAGLIVTPITSTCMTSYPTRAAATFLPRLPMFQEPLSFGVLALTSTAQPFQEPLRASLLPQVC